MAFDSLGEYVAALRRAGELSEIRTRVSAHLEISEITDRVVKAGGPALLFTDAEFAAYLGPEGERARELYAAGSFRALYSRGDVPGAVIEIEAADAAEAARLVGTLPFAVRGLMEYQIVPLRPYRVFAGTT